MKKIFTPFLLFVIFCSLAYSAKINNAQKNPLEKPGAPVVNGSGGPDAFGYTWFDSDAPGGPTFSWIDIATTGVAITGSSPWVASGTLSATDEGYIEIGLPFAFNFYGNEYSTAFIGTNGTLSFTAPSGSFYTNGALPAAGAGIDNFIAAFWDDMDAAGNGVIYYGMSGDNFVVQYVNVERYSGTVPEYTYEIILTPSNQVILQYLNMGISGGVTNSATIGIENSTGTIGLQVVNSATYVHNNLAIKFSLPQHQVGLTKFNNPLNGYPKPVNQSFIPQVQVKNLGLEIESNFQVELHIYYGSYSNEIASNLQSISSITPGQIIDLDFDEFTPSDTGTYIMRAISSLVDDYSPDDTVVSTFKSSIPLVGNYNVGTGGDFTTITSAVASLQNRVVEGAVTFLLTNSSYSESPITITYVGNEQKTITFKPAPGVNSTISVSGGFAIRDSGSQYITFDGSNTEGGTSRNLTINVVGGINAVRIVGASKHNTFKNCILRGSSTTTTTSRVVYFTATTATGGSQTDNIIENNEISNGYDGVYMAGANTTTQDKRNIVRKNIIGTSNEQIGHYGVYCLNGDSALIEKNTIQNLTNGSGDAVGVYLSTGISNIAVTGNTIKNISYTGTSTSKVYGIYTSSSSFANSNVVLTNNAISDLRSATATATSTTYNVVGIYMGTGNNNIVNFNSIYLSGDLGNSSASSYGMYVGDTAYAIVNNIFAHVSTGDTGKDYAVYFATAGNISQQGGAMDRNIYFVSGTKGYVGYWSAADRKTLLDWQTITNQDQNSYSGNPRFASTSDLHIPDNTKSLANNVGFQFINTDIDIDGETRDPGNPDIGADEFNGQTPLSVDVSAFSIDNPVSGRSKKSGISFTPQATFFNEATTDASNISVNCTITRIGDATVIFTDNKSIASLTAFSSTQVTFSAVNAGSLTAGEYTVAISTTLAGDGDNSNDSKNFNFTVKDPLAGNLNIGEGQTYTTLTSAINDLKDVGIGAPVTLKLTSGVYNEIAPISLTGIAGINRTTALTIKPEISTIINIAGTSSEPWGLRIKALEGLILDGSTTAKGNDRSLTINATGVYGKYGVLFDTSTSPRTQYNTLKNVKITTGASSVISSTGYYGVWLNGSTNKDTANEVVNCDITNFGEAGIRADKQHQLMIKNNFIHDWTQSSGATTVRGIWLRTGTTSSQVIANIINNIKNEVNTNGALGIANEIGTGSNLLCTNNMISGILANGAGGGANITRGIYSNASNQNDSYFYNSINLNGSDASTSTTSRSACIEFGLGATNPKFLNNIFANTTTFGENTAIHSFGYYLITPPSGATFDYNDIYSPGGAVGYDGTVRTTITDWSSTGRDINSASADPKFVSSSDLHISGEVRTVAESWGNATGITGIVDVDIDGNIRFGSAGYNGQSTIGVDVGADEGDFQQEYWTDILPSVVNNPTDGSIKRINDIFSPVATFQNIGFKRLQNFPVSLVIKNSNNFILYNETVTGLDIAVSGSQQVIFPPIDGSALADAGVYTAEATMSTDDNASNNVLVSTFIVKGPLSGTYNVGAGGNYSTLANALEELSILGVNAATTYNLLDASFNLSSPIVLDSIKGASPANTLTIDGNGAVLNISGNDASDSAAIRLRGASYITLQELTVTPLWNKARYGVWVKSTPSNSASHNTIQNCVITTGAIANQSQSGYFGVLLDSISLWKDTNNRVINCDITKFGLVGISARKNAGAVIQGNNIHDWNIQSGGLGTDVRGIIINVGSTNSEVKGNTIKNIIASVAGIRVHGIENNVGSSSSLLCANNMVINVRSSGGGSSANTTRGIYSSSTNNSGDEYYFNTVILTGGNNSTSPSSISSGIEINVGGSTAFTLLNNNVYQTMTHGNVSAKAQCIKLTLAPQASSWSSNYNNFHFINTGETSPVYLGTILATDYSTIAAWRAGSSKDAASISADPRFVASDDGHIRSDRPESPVNGAGITIAGFTTDIDGDTRLSAPDIGADEVSVVNVISGKKYHDIDANIATVLDRTPLENWKVYLSQNGNVIDSQLTDVTGTYTFSNLATGTYVVQEEEQFGWTPLGVQLGTGADASSEVSTTSMQLDVNDGDDAVNFNFINAQPGVIAIRVYADADAKYYTDNRSNKNWGIKLYRDSISSATIVDSVQSDSVLNYTGAPGTYIAVEADSNKWVAVAHMHNGLVDSTFNVTRDTFDVAAGTQQEVQFINFQKNSVTIRSLEDDDGSFYFSSSDRTAKKWNLSLRGIDSVVAFIDTMVASDSMLVSTFLPAGTYVIAEADTDQWTHLGIITSTRNVRTTQSADTIVLGNGCDSVLTFVNTLYKPDTTKYRTFSQLEYGTKAVKMKPKKVKNVGLVYPDPSGGNVRDAAFVKFGLGKGNPLYVGIPRIDSAKIYGWVMITKAKGAFDKLLNPAMTGASTYFTHIKALKDPAQKKLNNHLVGEILALKTSIIASDEDIISPTADVNENNWKLGDLIYLDEDSTSFYHNKNLRLIITYADTFLTYGKRKEQLGDTVNFAKLDTIFTRINRAFHDPSGLALKDTLAYTNLRVRATMKLADNADFLKRDIVVPPKSFSFSNRIVPEAFALQQNYPNPFNPTTTIEFELPEEAFVNISVYNVLGQRVRTLISNERVAEGFGEFIFDASTLPSGVYFYHLEAKSVASGKTHSFSKKMVLMK
ncbi:MAG: T9SS type A sorting domain-containing protein [Bacteroidota bacterium]